MRNSDCPMEISLPGISLAPALLCGRAAGTSSCRKSGRDFLGWDSGRGMRQLSSFCAQPPLDPSREAERRRLPGPRELAIRFE